MKINYVFEVDLIQGDIRLGTGPANVIADSLDQAVELLMSQVRSNFPDNGTQNRQLAVFRLQAMTVPRTSWEEMQAEIKAAGVIQRPN